MVAVAPINLIDERIDRRCIAVRKSLVALSTYYDEMSKQQVFDTCQIIMNEMLDIIIELSERGGGVTERPITP
jgi:hypothetical protein